MLTVRSQQLLRRGARWRNNEKIMGSLSSSIENHLFLRKEDDDDVEKNKRLQQVSQIRSYNATTIDNRGASAALILASVAATAKAGQYTIQAYNEWKESQPPAEEETKEETTTKAAKEEPQQQQKEQKKDGGKRENFFAKFFNMGVGSKYYEGGFEDKMTKREAALILGVRESSTPKQIKEAHRKLLILNHPDTGGSTYISGKVNEAKELLLKGKTG